MTKKKMKIFILLMPLFILLIWCFNKGSSNLTNNYLTDIISNLDDIVSNYGFGVLQTTFVDLLNLFNIDTIMCNVIAWYFSYAIIVEMIYLVYSLFCWILSFMKVSDY